MRRRLSGLFLFLLIVWYGPHLTVHADGLLPPEPYRYLHPPPISARTNRPPLSGIEVVPTDYLRAVGVVAFTGDGQANLFGRKGAFHVDPGTTAVTVRLRPVDPPPGLPRGLGLDGNAYRIVAAEQPSGRPTSPARTVSVNLRWPHRPTAIYRYDGHRWLLVCTADQARFTSGAMACATHALGIFAAVAPLSELRASNPTTPWLQGHVLLLIGLVVLAGIAAAGVLMHRRRASREEM